MDDSPPAMSLDDKKSIRVLICCANLGNAQPDSTSVNEWIPTDGYSKHVMQFPPRFPVIMNPARATNPTNAQSPAGGASFRKINIVGTNGNPASEVKPTTLSSASSSEIKEGAAAPPTDDLGRQSSTGSTYSGFLRAQTATEEDVDYEAYIAAQTSALDNLDLNGGASDDEYADFMEIRPRTSSFEFREAPANDKDDGSAEHPSFVSASSSSVEESPNFEAFANFDGPSPAPPPPSEANGGSSPKQGAKSPPTSQRREQQFDIIVIGMQEATFKTAGMHGEVEDCVVADNDIAVSDEWDLDDGHDSSSSEELEEESIATSATSETTADSDHNNDSSSGTTKSKKSKYLTSKMMSATLKVGKKVGKVAGKSTLKVGKVAGKSTLKVGKGAGKATFKAGKATMKTTVKTAKTAKTLTTAKDHTNKSAPTPQQFMTPLMSGSNSQWTDTVALHYLFEEQLPSYKRALSYQLGEMRLMIYYKESAIDLEMLSCKTQATGKAGLANKGGIVAEVAVNQSTRLAFLTAHLEAHEGAEKYATRCSSFRDILHGTHSSATPCKYDAALASHFMFVMGDLNFRTKLPDVEAGSDRHIEICHKMAAKKDWVSLNKFDELSQALRKKDCLNGFQTPYCNFDPTFKVSREFGYDYNPKRSPSYTDRILFKTADQLELALRPILYEPIDAFTTSDHKPIRGAFDIRLNEKFDCKPVLMKKRQSGKRESLSLKHPVTPIPQKNPQESLHLFVSSIQCTINSAAYDKSRKSDYEFPSPFVSFVSTPPEAVQTESSKSSSKWQKLGLLNSPMSQIFSKNGVDDKARKKSSVPKSMMGWPGTTLQAGTFKPNWKNEEVHFAVRTHNPDGRPIDLSGALLHVSVFDGKGSEPKLVGAFSLNLARLVQVSREPPPAESRALSPASRGGGAQPIPQRGGTQSARFLARGGPGRGRVQGRGPPGQGTPTRKPLQGNSQGRGVPNVQGRQAPNMQGREGTNTNTQGRGPPQRNRSAPNIHARGARNPNTQRRAPPTRNRSAKGASMGRQGSTEGRRQSSGGRDATGRGPMPGRLRTPRATGWSYSSGQQPSVALQGVLQKDGYPAPVRKAAKSLTRPKAPEPSRSKRGLLNRQGSMSVLNSGPSRSLRDLMVDSEQTPEEQKIIDEQIEELRIVSLKLDEPLMESGVEVGRIKCSIDAWWMEESRPPGDSATEE